MRVVYSGRGCEIIEDDGIYQILQPGRTGGTVEQGAVATGGENDITTDRSFRAGTCDRSGSDIVYRGYTDQDVRGQEKPSMHIRNCRESDPALIYG